MNALLTSSQRRRGKHLMKNGEIAPFSRRNFLIRYALRKWGRSTEFGPEYHKYFRLYPMRLGLSLAVTRLHIKVGRFSWETWAYTLTPGFDFFTSNLPKGA